MPQGHHDTNLMPRRSVNPSSSSDAGSAATAPRAVTSPPSVAPRSRAPRSSIDCVLHDVRTAPRGATTHVILNGCGTPDETGTHGPLQAYPPRANTALLRSRRARVHPPTRLDVRRSRRRAAQGLREKTNLPERPVGAGNTSPLVTASGRSTACTHQPTARGLECRYHLDDSGGSRSSRAPSRRNRRSGRLAGQWSERAFADTPLEPADAQ